nr:flagellar basal body-associated FliL family protein [Defluviimonas sediminis]
MPILLVLIGLGGGAAGGYLLRPEPEPAPEATEGAAAETCAPATGEQARIAETPEAAAQVEYVKLNNQFVVPVMNGGDIRSLVILSLSVEVEAGQAEVVYTREPKLRDAFLRVLFDHANTGGFDGSFTESGTIESLRRGLRAAAQDIIGSTSRDVLILDIIRQAA